jgi:hypothetical protein
MLSHYRQTREVMVLLPIVMIEVGEFSNNVQTVESMLAVELG